MSGMAWIAHQILSAKPDGRPPRFNPRPPGVIQRGAAFSILVYMRQHPGRLFTSLDLIRALGLTHSAVSWGLYFLRQLGHIETYPDPRNTRYLMYRLLDKPDPLLRDKNDRNRTTLPG